MALSTPDALLERVRTLLGDRYDIDRQTGHGGMAVVFHAWDQRYSREVAIKVLKPEITSAVVWARFLQEINIGASLQHPHIVPLYDSGEVDDLLYLVMPFVQGETLRQRLRRESQLSTRDTVDIIKDVGSALEYAHGRGIVHRDIKPENIHLTSGKAVVADFGVARAVVQASGESLTSQGHIVGTARYMSPEQATGSDIDARSDVYSLGCVAYELLTGKPPFDGPNMQAVIAQQITAAATPITVLRPDAPLNLVAVIERSLSKVPADRFSSVDRMVRALDAAKVDGLPRRWTRRVVGFAGVVALAVVSWLGIRTPPVPLDPDRVVVFPLRELGVPAASGLGEGAASMVLAALEHAEPLRVIDPWNRLSDRQRSDGGAIGADDARRISRERGAAYYIHGIVQGVPDSVIVTLSLHDVAEDSVVLRRSHRGGTGEAQAYRYAIDALVELLPTLLGEEVDLTHLRDRAPSAIALWIQGEKLYRRAAFSTALDRYRRSVELDADLVFAAVKGAQAASWAKRGEEAASLIDLALSRPNLLPRPYLAFARGVRAYQSGQADSAVAHFEAALAAKSGWAEAATGLGEVYYHLLPKGGSPAALAEYWLRESLAADEFFRPPLFHLAEIAARRGDLDEARRFMTAFADAEADSVLTRRLRLAVGCVERGPEAIDWRAEVDRDPRVVVVSAASLAVGGSQLACAEAGFRAVLDGASRSERAAERSWGALLGLQGGMVAQGRFDEALAVLDSADAAGTTAVKTVYILDSLAGAQMGSRAMETIAFGRRVFGDDFAGVVTANLLWVFGVWEASHSARESLDAMYAHMQRKAEEGVAGSGLFAEALAGHRDLLDGDTDSAIRRFSALDAEAHFDDLAWSMELPVAVERLKLADLLFASGRYDEAIDAASVFDHPGPIMFLPFLPASLSIRMRAAEELGDSEAAADYRERLLGIGRLDLVDVGRDSR